MRCFLPCFATSKRRNRLRSANATPPQAPLSHVVEGAVAPLAQQKTDCIAASKIKYEEQSNNIVEAEEEKEKGSREEEAPQIQDKKNDGHEEDDEINGRSHQEESSESLFSLSICSRQQVSDAEAEVNSPMQHHLVCKRGVPEQALGSSPTVQLQHVSSASVMATKEENPKPNEQPPTFIAIKKEESSAKELLKKLDENKGEKGKANHSVTEYRYGDCSDEGYDYINLDATFEDDDDPPKENRVEEEGADVKRTWVQEETSDSLFSLSTDSRKRISSAEEVENEVNSLMPMSAHVTNRITQEETQGRIPDVTSVLNPIDNLTQERAVKAIVQQPLENDKENINLVVQDVNIPISSEPTSKLSNRKARQRFSDKKQEIGVDASLSSWLVESETTPVSMNNTGSVGEHTPKGRRGSPWSHEDRPILGALTVEEIRMFSISISPKRSRSRSPDDTPIIGTVGSYWSHTQQNMDSEFNKSGKDVKLKRSSTALQTRLERAFEASASEV